jgi:hypothetical protein
VAQRRIGCQPVRVRRGRGPTLRGPGVTQLSIELDTLPPAERRDLANALLRAAWSATLEETRIRLLDLLVEADEAILGDTS